MREVRQLFNKLLNDYKTELTEEFDRNFERKAFFNQQWKGAIRNNIGSLMMRTGALRSSISSSATVEGNSVRWSSSLPYAGIHNTGGKIIVTAKMRSFFWYKFKEATGGDNKNINTDAAFWKAMALKKAGSTITMHKRQFVGEHPQVHKSIKTTTDDWFQNDFKPFVDRNLNIFD